MARRAVCSSAEFNYRRTSAVQGVASERTFKQPPEGVGASVRRSRPRGSVAKQAGIPRHPKAPPMTHLQASASAGLDGARFRMKAARAAGSLRGFEKSDDLSTARNSDKAIGSLDGAGAGDHGQPYRFGRRPRTSVPYPARPAQRWFNTRQYARLLVLRGRRRDTQDLDLRPAV